MKKKKPKYFSAVLVLFPCSLLTTLASKSNCGCQTILQTSWLLKYFQLQTIPVVRWRGKSPGTEVAVRSQEAMMACWWAVPVMLRACETSSRVPQARTEDENLDVFFATRARPCCWHRATESLCTLCKACGKTNRLGNKTETLIKENLLILSSPGCSFAVALNWPNYSLVLKSIGIKAWIFSSSLVLALEMVLHTLRRT